MISSIDLFDALKLKLGEAEAKILVKKLEETDASVDVKIEKTFDNKKDVLATKTDINSLKIDMADLRTEMAESRAEIIKWSFIFWVGQVMIFAGMFIAIYLKIK